MFKVKSSNKEGTIMKRIYFQPEITVASIALQSNLLAGSGEPSNTLGVNEHEVSVM